MRKHLWLFIVLCTLLTVSCDRKVNRQDQTKYTTPEQIYADSTLQCAARYACNGQSNAQLSLLDSIAPVVAPFENGSESERMLYSLYLRNRLLYYAKFTDLFDSMLYYGQKARDYSLKWRDYRNAVQNSANLGDVYRQRGSLFQAIAEYDRALRLNDSIVRDTALYMAVYSGLSCTYTAMRVLDKAEEWALRMEPLSASMSLQDSISFRQMLGVCYYYQQDYARSMRWHMSLDSLLLHHPELQFDRQVCNVNIADLYIQTNQSGRVGRLLDDALEYFTQQGVTAFLPYIHTLQIQQLVQQGKSREALRLAEGCMSEIPGMNPDFRITRYATLSSCLYANDEQEEAYHYHKMEDLLEDSVRCLAITMQSQELEHRYMHDAEIAANRLKHEQDRVTMLSLWLLVVGLVLLITLLGVYTLHRRRINRQEREKALNKIVSLRNEVIHNRITPHFISNVLALGEKLSQEDINSIISLIRTSLSYEHLLMVDFDREYRLVQTYAEIARLVGLHPVELNSEIDTTVDTSRLQIPSMAILIIIENAIKHGQVCDDGIRHICFSLGRESDNVVIRVTNCGTLSDYNRHRDSAMHGLMMLQQTIDLINQRNRKHLYSFSITDSPEGKVISTLTIKPHNRITAK